jgi:hypothetical protein
MLEFTQDPTFDPAKLRNLMEELIDYDPRPSRLAYLLEELVKMHLGLNLNSERHLDHEHLLAAQRVVRDLMLKMVGPLKPTVQRYAAADVASLFNNPPQE